MTEFIVGFLAMGTLVVWFVTWFGNKIGTWVSEDPQAPRCGGVMFRIGRYHWRCVADAQGTFMLRRRIDMLEGRGEPTVVHVCDKHAKQIVDVLDTSSHWVRVEQ